VKDMNLRARKALVLSTLLLILLVALSRDSLHPVDQFQYLTDPFTGAHRFDWGSYEIHTVVEKILSRALGTDQPSAVGTEDQIPLVNDYFSLVQEIGRLESQIAMQRARNGDSADTSALQAELAARQRERDQQENVVENIIRRQAEEVLLSQGITLNLPLLKGRVMPPVAFEFQASPDFLIVSRRDRIDRIGSVSLQPHLSLEQIEDIEELTDQLGVSSLVVPTGGVGAYPTVIVEKTSLDFAIRVVIHEWTHNYLYFHPLGQHYGDSQELTSMNETVASMVEDELSLELARRYYPDVYERRMAEIAREQVQPPQQRHEDEFSFNAIMRKTRIRVEELLKLGEVEQAEAYMEQQRQKLVEMGYGLRKLNQAYFAFYGSYSAGKGWAAETNPIGEQMNILRERSPSLADFLSKVGGMSSYEDLLDELHISQESASASASAAHIPAQA
jgi:hypothetical protein